MLKQLSKSIYKLNLYFIIIIIILLSTCNKASENSKKEVPIVSDNGIYKFTGDFDGNNFTDLAYWKSDDGSIWFGLYDGSRIKWVEVYKNIDWRTVPIDSNIYKFTGNYVDSMDKIVKTYIGFWYHGDGNIWSGKYNGEILVWDVVGTKIYHE